MSERQRAERLYREASRLVGLLAQRLEAAIVDRDMSECERLHGVFVAAQARMARRLNRWGTLVIWNCDRRQVAANEGSAV